MQAQQSRHSVHVLTSMLLRFNDHHTALGDAVIAQIEKPVFQCHWQAGGMNVKVQLNGAGHLVHILTARPLRPDGRQHNLMVWNVKYCHEKP